MIRSLYQRYQQLARVELFFVMLLIVMVFTGWFFDIAEFRKGMVNSVSMNPVTGLLCAICVVSLWCVTRPQQNKHRIGQILAIIVLTVGAVRLFEITGGFNVGIAQWLFTSELIEDRIKGFPNTIAPNTAISMVLTGASLAFYHVKFRAPIILSDWFAMLTLLISLGSLIGYLYEDVHLHAIYGSIPMAVPSALSFFLISSAVLLFRSDVGILRLLLKSYFGSRMARYLIPLALLLPIASGIARKYTQLNLGFDGSFSLGVIIMINIVFMILLIWRGAVSINRNIVALEKERMRAEQLNERLRREETKKLQRKLMETKIEQQKALIQATIEGQEKEKKQIGMELHDHINQILASTKLYLEVAKSDVSLREQMIVKCSEQIHFAINEIRNLSRSLVLHDSGKESILENITMLVNNLRHTGGLQITTELSYDAMNQLEKQQQVSVYRIVEEQLQNVMKHARASHVFIKLWLDKQTVRLMVNDNGKGFDPNQLRKGIGLSNINSRVTSMDGQLQIVSAPGSGCELNISIPV